MHNVLIYQCLFIVAPSSSVLNVTAQPVDSEGIFLSWMPPLFIHRNGLIRSYRVYLIETDTGREYNYTVFATNLTVTELHPYYTYSCSVSPVTVKPGPFSSPVFITTPEDGEFDFIIASMTDHIQLYL